MIAKQKRTAFICIGIAMALGLIAALGGDGESMNLLSGFASGFLGVGLIRLLILRRRAGTPEQAADYEASMKDERTAYIANKARSMTFAIFVLLQLAGGLIALFVFCNQLVGQIFCFLTAAQCIVYTVILRMYWKKY